MHIGRLGLLRPDISSSGPVTGLEAGELPSGTSSAKSKKIGTDDAVRVTLSRSASIGDLEKHLDDVAKGRGYLSANVAEKVKEEAISAGEKLAVRDPKSLEFYSRFVGTVTYDRKARFIHAIKSAAEALELLNHGPTFVEEAAMKVPSASPANTGNNTGGEGQKTPPENLAA